ncbi:hypothetical protein HPC49_09530 [Pyxidicoccus fallax]|uniref:Uncharacterized protein n=1 Tax=Pyxidicoccus fallax TaxID=394095 RepID=A0A848L4B0_9BACT|nr:hypothetical protein [Pyxidicoccus fallax]NMO13479.1 hypothetical protein [Pyxidicoccus fallax]NPC78483.1 hypothetical protein [Pyxidicoccus fallax]
MHLVSKVDGLDYVVVLDGLGLTSWCLPDEVVSDQDVHASSEGLLSTDGAGRLVLAWDDGYSRSHLVRVDTLEREERYPRFELKYAFLDAAGEALFLLTNLQGAVEVARCTRSGTEEARKPLPFPDKPQVTLSTGWFTPRWTRPRYAARAGRLAVVDTQGRALAVDLRDFDAPKVVASALLEVPPTWDVQVIPFDDALGVIAHDVPRGTAMVWVVSGGDVLVKKELAALTMPTFATKDAVLTQVSDGVLERVPLRGGAARTLRLPEVGRETKLDPRGGGRPIAGGDVTAFLPWHGESLFVFDEETGEPTEVSRLLPEDARELRQFILQRVRVANEAARSTGTRYELHRLSISRKRKNYQVEVSAHGGDGSFWAHAVMSALHGLQAELSGRAFGELRLAILGQRGIPVGRVPVIDVDEVAAMLARVDQYGLRFSSLVSTIDAFYARSMPVMKWDASNRPPVTDAAGLVLLQAFFAWLTSEAPVKLAPGVERWRRSPESVASLAARVPHLQASHAAVEFRLLVALAQLASVHFGAEAGPLLLALAQDAHQAHLQFARSAVVNDVLRWWARRHEKAARSLVERTTDPELRRALGAAS